MSTYCIHRLCGTTIHTDKPGVHFPLVPVTGIKKGTWDTSVPSHPTTASLYEGGSPTPQADGTKLGIVKAAVQAGSMSIFTQVYIQPGLYSLFTKVYVHPGLCSPKSIFTQVYVYPGLCSPPPRLPPPPPPPSTPPVCLLTLTLTIGVNIDLGEHRLG